LDIFVLAGSDGSLALKWLDEKLSVAILFDSW